MNRIFSASLAAALGFVLLGTLGIWQLERLAWKEELISRLDAKLARNPVPFERIAPTNDAEFTKVTVTGTFVPAQSLFLVTTFEGGGGWQVITPLLLADGQAVLVDRGVIPAAERDEILTAAASAPITLTGVLRLNRDKPGLFTPPNDAASNRWYWWDVPAMYAALKLRDGPVIQKLPEAGDSGLPRAFPAGAKLVNNHLQYAITWFAFAAILAVITFLFIRGQMRNTAA